MIQLSNCKFNLSVRAKDIYDKLSPEDKNKYKNIMITDAKLFNNKELIIECLALNDDVEECGRMQAVLTGDILVI